MLNSFRSMLLVALLLALAPLAAAQPDNRQIARDAINRKPPGESLVIDLRSDAANGKGSSVKGASDNVAMNHKADAPQAEVNGRARSTGGGSSDSFDLKTAINGWLIAGVACLALGVYLQWFFPRKNPDGSIAKAPDGTPIKGNPHAARTAWIAGGAMTAYALMPGWLVAILIVGAVALVVCLVAVAVTHPALVAGSAASHEAARAMAEGAAKLPSAMFRQWMTNVENAATRPTDSVILRDIVQKDDLHKLNADESSRAR